MDIVIADTRGLQARVIIRRAGYAEHFDRNSGQTSYVRRLASVGFYPRFHAYLKSSEGDSLTISLHIDQKQPSYGAGAHAHSGEYEGPLLERERERIVSVISLERRDEPPKEKSGFWSKFFGSK